MRKESSRAGTSKSAFWGGRGSGLITAALLLVSALGAPSGPALADGQPPPFQVVQAQNHGLIVEWVPPPIETRTLDDGRLAIAVPGYSRAGAAGMPLLPVSAHLVALPPGPAPQLRVLEVDQTTQRLHALLELAPWPDEMRGDPQALVRADDTTAMAEPGGIGAEGAVVLEELGTLRGVRLARLAFYPAVPHDGSLLVTRQLRVAISWEAQVGLSRAASDPLLDQVRAMVLNPQDALPAPGSMSAAGVSAPTATATALLVLSEPGLYEVGYGDLDDLGFATANPGSIRLFRGTAEAAYHWVGDSDQLFEPDESLIFYGEPRFSRWTEIDVYRLEADTFPGRHMATRSADPGGLADGAEWLEQPVEENEVYTPDALLGQLPPGRDGDRWAWRALERPGQDTTSVSFDIDDADLSQAAELTLWFIGYTFDDEDPDHRVQVTLNGQSLGQVEWESATAHEATFSIPAGVLEDSDNTLSLRLPGISGVSDEGCWLDAFSVQHAREDIVSATGLIFEGGSDRRAYTVDLADVSELRAYDVTDPLSPRRLTGVQVSGNSVELGDPPEGRPRRYALAGASGLRAPDSIRAKEGAWGFNPAGEPAGADLLIVTHPDFASALGPLVALREAQGLSVAVANAMGVYDNWGDGRLDPQAIHALIQHAYDHWDPVPTYVLLVGDGSYDPRQYLTSSSATFIPPYLADVDPWAGEAAADNRYVCVDGDDGLPDMMIGRLPVKTLAEAQAVVSKIVAYEAEPGLGRWNRHVVLAADDADVGGDFPALADSHAGDLVPSSYRLTRYYCTEGSPSVSDCPAARAQEIHDGVIGTWNAGAFLIGYVGHASWQQWAVPRYLHLEDLPSLENEAQAPVVVGMTCFTSAFQRPEPTLDEGLVTLADGGAVATWGGTGLGLTTAHGLLSEAFFDAVLIDEVERVGEAELAGKLHLAATGPNTELVDTFVVLGDPALVLNRAADTGYEVFLPLVTRGG